MDMERTPTAEMVPSSRPGTPFFDLMERFTAVRKGPRLILLRGRLAPGLHLMEMETAPGSFPVETLMLPLVRWPTLDAVPTGPFDFDHTRYEMTVPVFRVRLDGADCGLVWCEVPSPKDMEARRIRAAWGLAVRTGGMHEISLELPETENRLRWEDASRIALGPDHRYELPLPRETPPSPERPRLFARPGTFAALAGELDPLRRKILDNIRAQHAAGLDGTYDHRTVAAALLAAVTGEEHFAAEAIDRTLAVCRRPAWGYHEVPEVMGWNNDRDTGMRLFETAVVYDWLRDRMTDAQRTLVAERLAHFAAIADRTTRLQYGYWYTRAPEAHGQGYWFGFGAAAAALLGEDDRAPGWLAWFRGNVHDALRHAPEDGISEWLVFNVQWLLLSLFLIERLSGRLPGNPPFPRAFGRNILRYAAGRSPKSGRGPKLPLLLFLLADRYADPGMQADAVSILPPPGADVWLDPLTLLACNPAVPAGRTSPRPDAVRSQNGTVVCRTRRDDAIFTFRCGSPLTARRHELHTWNTHIWYSTFHAGSFSWTVAGRETVPLALPSYRKLTSESNIISIDGRGHRMHARWLGGRIPLRHCGHIEHFLAGRGMTTCCGDARAAYTENFGVRLLRRRWVFFHGTGTVVMRDELETAVPRGPAWHIHTPGTVEEIRPSAFRLTRDGAAIAVAALRSAVEGTVAPPETAVGGAAYVPPYGFGLNTYKTRDWQPEVHGRDRKPPDYAELTLRPAGPAARWDLLTVMGPDEAEILAARIVEEGATITAELGGTGAVVWPTKPGGPVSIFGAAAGAELAVREGPADAPRRWTVVGCTDPDGAGEPADVVRAPGRNARPVSSPGN